MNEKPLAILHIPQTFFLLKVYDYVSSVAETKIYSLLFADLMKF